MQQAKTTTSAASHATSRPETTDTKQDLYLLPAKATVGFAAAAAKFQQDQFSRDEPRRLSRAERIRQRIAEDERRQMKLPFDSCEPVQPLIITRKTGKEEKS